MVFSGYIAVVADDVESWSVTCIDFVGVGVGGSWVAVYAVVFDYPSS